MSAIHIADTGLFVAMGQPSNRRYQVVRTFARRNDMTFVLPERVYDELTVNAPDVETPPVDTAIDEGGPESQPVGIHERTSLPDDGRCAAIHRER